MPNRLEFQCCCYKTMSHAVFLAHGNRQVIEMSRRAQSQTDLRDRVCSDLQEEEIASRTPTRPDQKKHRGVTSRRRRNKFSRWNDSGPLSSFFV